MREKTTLIFCHLLNAFILAFLCIAIMMRSSLPVSANADADYESIHTQLEKDVEKYHIPGMAVIVVKRRKNVFVHIIRIVFTADSFDDFSEQSVIHIGIHMLTVVFCNLCIAKSLISAEAAGLVQKLAYRNLISIRWFRKIT